MSMHLQRSLTWFLSLVRYASSSEMMSDSVSGFIVRFFICLKQIMVRFISGSYL